MRLLLCRKFKFKKKKMKEFNALITNLEEKYKLKVEEFSNGEFNSTTNSLLINIRTEIYYFKDTISKLQINSLEYKKTLVYFSEAAIRIITKIEDIKLS